MQSQVITETFSVTQADVMFVGHQINMDLQSFSKAYPLKLSLDYATSLWNSCVVFLYNYAVSEIGYSIHDPVQSDLVYHELRYLVLYGGDVAAIAPGGGRGGRGGRPISAVWVPYTAKFTPWVIWSPHMLGLSESEQGQIVSGTGWDIPGRNPTFLGTYEGGAWTGTGGYYSGNIGASGREYRHS